MKSKLKLYAAQCNPVVGDLSGNEQLIVDHYKKGCDLGADIVLFPELMLSGYSPEDLLLQPAFLRAVHERIAKIAALTNTDTALLFGTPWDEGTAKNVPDYVPLPGQARNAAVFCYDGKVQEVVFKSDLPNFGVFDERRYFKPAKKRHVFSFKETTIGVPICRDTWLADTCKELKELGAEILLSPNASPYHTGKHKDRYRFSADRANETGLPLLYLNLVGGQDSVVFDGRSFTVNPGDEAKNHFPSWQENALMLELEKSENGWLFTNNTNKQPAFNAHEDVYCALQTGLGDYVRKNGFKKAVLGLSGGVDSALVAVVAVDTLGAKNVTALLLPSPYTSAESTEDAEKLAKNLGITTHTLEIIPAMEAFNNMLHPALGSAPAGLTAENIQARIRGVSLMAWSNAFADTLLITTGNKSEMAVGYATLYGDMCGAFALLKDVYKTEVYSLCRWRNEQSATIPERILTKAPSAELRPDQTDQDNLPPYEILDQILKLAIEAHLDTQEIISRGFDEAIVTKVLNLLKTSEYKRKQSPPGVKVTPMSFDRDWRMPMTNKKDP